MNKTDVDRLVQLWLNNTLDHNLPLEPDLRLAIDAQRRGSVFVPHSLPPTCEERTPLLSLFGKRISGNIAAYAYNLNLPEQPRNYSVVMAFDNRRISHVGINLLPDMSTLPPKISELKIWQIDLSMTSKLVWFGFLPAYGLSRNMHFHIDRKRWTTMSNSEQTTMVDRAKKLTSDYRFIVFGKCSPVTFAINTHTLDAVGQMAPGDLGESVYRGRA